jgi:undecaprenyl-diphosphatase
MFSILEFLKYILLGIVQGITEVLPISSSGHVTIAQSILNIDTDQGILFLILVNLGSLIAILLHFRKPLFRLVKNFFLWIFVPAKKAETEEDFHYCLKIVVASVPAGIAGFFLADTIDALYADFKLVIVGVGLLITATFLYVVRNASYVNGRQKVSYRDAIAVGTGQMFAIIPGLSRSGITTSTGLLRKLSMETTLVFSFMLYIPISVGSFIKYFLEWVTDPIGFSLGFDLSNPWQYLYYLVAAIFSLFATLFSLKFIFVLFRKGKLIIFSIYTFLLGSLALIIGLSLM